MRRILQALTLAFSISRSDAAVLIEGLKESGSVKVWLDAVSRVRQNAVAYNITGKIPGKNKDRMILLSAHYDSYFLMDFRMIIQRSR